MKIAVRAKKNKAASVALKMYYDYRIKTLDDLHNILLSIFGSQKEAVSWLAVNDRNFR